MNTAFNLTPAALAALTAYAEEARRLASTCPGFRHSLETLPPVDPRNLPWGAARVLARSKLAVRDTACGEIYYALTPAGAAACAQNNIKLPACGEIYYALTPAGAAACAQNNIKLPLA